jgi:hypothetical protein
MQNYSPKFHPKLDSIPTLPILCHSLQRRTRFGDSGSNHTESPKGDYRATEVYRSIKARLLDQLPSDWCPDQ